jgi:DNA-binding CsgD family transcriptional regulator
MTELDSRQRGVAEADSVVGRSGELDRLRAFVHRSATDGEALLLFGEPGVGKTLLLDAAADVASAAGARVLRAGGVEFEAEMSFSGLNQALLPLFGEFARLSAAHHDALNVALGLGEGPAPDRLVVSNATLALLRQAATDRPLVVIVDDLPWLDRASAGVLGFVARRLAGSRVGFLAASRSGEESFFDRAGLAELEVRPLDDDAAARLVAARFPALAPGLRERVLVEARGNPLALLELPTALSGVASAPSRGRGSALPLTGRLQMLFASRIRALPARTRQLLLLMALDGTGDVRVLRVHAGGRGFGDLDPAERARLASVEERTRRLVFRHPLIRSVVVELSTGEERRGANRVLAELWADQPDRRAWHLADATVEPDEQVAMLLEKAAYRILARGDGVASVAAFTRASELSPRDSDCSRRLAEAAYIGADVTGELRSASRLLTEVRRGDPELKRSLEASVAASAVMLSADGDVDTAHRLLVAAIERRADRGGVGDAALEEGLYTLMVVCFFAGRAEQWAPFHRAIARLTRHLPATLYLSSRFLADPVRTAPAALEQLDAAIEGLAHEVDPNQIVRTAMAGVYVDRLAGCREALRRVVREGREGGAIASCINAGTLLGVDDFCTGQWDEAWQLFDEAVELYEAHGYLLFAWRDRAYQAKLAAARGDYDTTRALIDRMIQWAAPRRVRALQRFAWHAQALAALGRGDFEEAYEHATAISPAGTLASHVPDALYVLMDVVEAAVRTGRHAEAAAHVAAMREANIAALSSRLALVVGGSAALAAADDGALRLFDDALAIPGVERWPFDLARVQLAYGERLRRAQATSRSRPHLAAALESFERLGARPWATRAANELRATGQSKPRADERDRDSLTPQEHEIAMLAAAGLTNKQIGQRLFLSHRTVGGHLHRVFPKLGVTSRAALRDALASLSQEQPDQTRS